MIDRLPSSLKELRPRLSKHFWVSILGYAIFFAFVWYTGTIDDLSARITLTLLYTIIPLAELFQKPHTRAEGRALLWQYIALLLVVLAFLLLGLSTKFDRPGFGAIVILLMVSAPFLLLFGLLVRRAPLLGVALVPAGIAAEAYLVIPAIDSAGVKLEVFLLPLPSILFVSVVWSVAAHFLLKCARKRRRAKIWGPATESFLMLFLFLPLMSLAILIPVLLTDDRASLAVSLAIIGVLFGSVVSTPLRQLLLDLGKLPPIRR